MIESWLCPRMSESNSNQLSDALLKSQVAPSVVGTFIRGSVAIRIWTLVGTLPKMHPAPILEFPSGLAKCGGNVHEWQWADPNRTSVGTLSQMHAAPAFGLPSGSAKVWGPRASGAACRSHIWTWVGTLPGRTKHPHLASHDSQFGHQM